jgi:hypothetical protein
MNYWRLNLAWMVTGAMVVTGFRAAYGQQQSSTGGRKIEFSESGRNVVASNLNTITQGKATFQNPDEDLQKPYELFSPGNSLHGIEAPPAQRMPPSAAKRLKELLEKRKEWIYLTPEDYHSEPTIEEIFGIPEYGPNGEAKEKKSPLERYYERLERGNTAVTNRNRNDGLSGLAFGRKKDGSEMESNLTGAEHEPGSVPEMDNPLSHLLRGNSGNPLVPDRTRPTGFSDVFGRQNSEWKPQSPEALRGLEARLEEYRRILDSRTLPSSSPVSGITPFDPSKLPGSPSTTSAFAPPSSPEPAPLTPVTRVRDSFNPFSKAVGILGVSELPSGLPEVSTSVPGLTPSAPLPEPTRTVAPAPDFNIPKRRF